MLAIHPRDRSFSDIWIPYCEKNGIPFKLVNCYRSDIVQQLHGCRGLMWHWSHGDLKAKLFARQLALALELDGMPVFPSVRTAWHFDDKIGQKYIFEKAGIPFVPTFVFYDRDEALQWLTKTSFPKVFKLRSGAGSSDVRLVRDLPQARKLVRKMFGRGMASRSYAQIGQDKLRAAFYSRDKNALSFLRRGAKKVLLNPSILANKTRERGYAYFQEFIPDNSFDIRVVVIGDKAFAIKRGVRKGDFRASGSGNIEYDQRQIPEECVRLAFHCTNGIGSQCAAYDFVFAGQKPLVVEVSYGFTAKAYLNCPGVWRRNLEWQYQDVRPAEMMMVEFLKEIELGTGKL